VPARAVPHRDLAEPGRRPGDAQSRGGDGRAGRDGGERSGHRSEGHRPARRVERLDRARPGAAPHDDESDRQGPLETHGEGPGHPGRRREVAVGKGTAMPDGAGRALTGCAPRRRWPRARQVRGSRRPVRELDVELASCRTRLHGGHGRTGSVLEDPPVDAAPAGTGRLGPQRPASGFEREGRPPRRPERRWWRHPRGRDRAVPLAQRHPCPPETQIPERDVGAVRLHGGAGHRAGARAIPTIGRHDETPRLPEQTPDLTARQFEAEPAVAARAGPVLAGADVRHVVGEAGQSQGADRERQPEDQVRATGLHQRRHRPPGGRRPVGPQHPAPDHHGGTRVDLRGGAADHRQRRRHPRQRRPPQHRSGPCQPPARSEWMPRAERLPARV
jgi:hypothetical protein